MSSTQRPADNAALAPLIQSCKTLCADAEAKIGKLSPERESFLTHSLGDTLRQLELVLRVFEEDLVDPKSKDEQKGFLRRFFGRTETSEGREFTPPRFDVARQGLQGNSLTVPLTELLGFLAYGKKTGVLWIDTPEENFLLGIVNGRIMHATSDATPEGQRLGEVLVGLGYLTRRQLERFLTQRSQSSEPVSGEILLEGGMISDEELRAALVFQVRQLVYRVVAHKNALFRFRESMEVVVAFQVDLDINQLLLESARVHDEASNAGLRRAAAMNDWRSWQEDLNRGLQPVPPAKSPQAPLPSGERAASSESDPGDEAREPALASKPSGSAHVPVEKSGADVKGNGAGPAGSKPSGPG